MTTGPRADHAHGDGDKKLALGEPARLLHEALLEERNDHEATAERERPCLEEERQELAEHGRQTGTPPPPTTRSGTPTRSKGVVEADARTRKSDP